MKRYSRIVALLLVVLFTLGTFTGCIFSPEKAAEREVDRVLSEINSENLEKIKEILDFSEDENTGFATELITDSLLTLLFKNFEYEIISSQAIDDEYVEVTVNITNTDMGPVVTDFVKELTEYALKNLGEISSMTEEESSKIAMEILEECLSKEDLSTTTKEVVIHVNKVDGEWNIDMKDTLVDAILGGFMSAFESADI